MKTEREIRTDELAVYGDESLVRMWLTYKQRSCSGKFAGTASLFYRIYFF